MSQYWIFLPGLGFIFYLLFNLRTFYFFRPSELKFIDEKPLPSLCIIVPARNEARTIESTLQALLYQVYPNQELEIIVVDDHSTDETFSVAKKWKGITCIQLPENRISKKEAITFGIEHTQAEIILCTDADCVMEKSWAKTMVQYFDEKTEMVCGPVQLVPAAGFFTSMQALEFAGLIATGAAGIESGKPTLANGANIAYRRSAFLKAGGFSSHAHIVSGDDEFLLHKIVSKNSHGAKFCYSPEAIVKSKAEATWKGFRNQRIRWVSKSRHYDRKSITFSLFLIWFGMWSFPFLFVGSFFDSYFLGLFLLFLLLKVMSEGIILWKATRLFRQEKLLWYLVPESVLHIAYVIWIGIAGNFYTFNWKERTNS